jgi:hypothetical protein
MKTPPENEITRLLLECMIERLLNDNRTLCAQVAHNHRVLEEILATMKAGNERRGPKS